MNKTFSLYSNFKLITKTADIKIYQLLWVLFQLGLCFMIMGTYESAWKPRREYDFETET